MAMFLERFQQLRVDALAAVQPFSTEGFEDPTEVTLMRSSNFNGLIVLERLDFVYSLDTEFDTYKVYYRYVKSGADMEYVRSDTFFVAEASCVAADPVDVAKEIEYYCFGRIAQNEAENPL